MKYLRAAIIALAAALIGGCGLTSRGSGDPAPEGTTPPKRAGYTHAALLPRDIRTIRIYVAENTTFRREFELPVTKAVINEIQSSTALKITDANPDSVLEVTVIDVQERVNNEDRYDVPISSRVTLRATLKWTDGRTGKEIPLRQTTVSASATYAIGRGDNFFNAAQEATEKLARAVVESMQEEW